MSTFYREFSLGVFAVLSISGCTRNQNQNPAPPVATSARKIDSSTTGSITGRVILEGEPPVIKPIDMSAEPFCEKFNTVPARPPQVVTGSAGGLANVVVYVKNFPAEYGVHAPTNAVPLAQRGCMYAPHVVALMTGQRLEIMNQDQATHNLLAMPALNPKWNKSETPGAAPIEESFAIPELAIPLRCNVHPWMKSYVFVFSHPYFTVTSDDGRFELKNLPPGTYAIEAWQEMYATEEQNITIGARESKAVNFRFRVPSRAAGE